jgi:hypothetical protein
MLQSRGRGKYGGFGGARDCLRARAGNASKYTADRAAILFPALSAAFYFSTN